MPFPKSGRMKSKYTMLKYLNIDKEIKSMYSVVKAGADMQYLYVYLVTFIMKTKLGQDQQQKDSRP